MKIRFLSVLMAGAMAAGLLAGCGSSSSSTSSAASSSAAASVVTDTSEATGGTASSASSGTSSVGDVTGALEGVSLVLGTSGTYAPFSYFADDGTTLEGFDIDMLNALQKILGFTIANDKLQDMDYGPLGTSLGQGQLDVGAAALCATDERKKSMNFSETYYDAGIIVCVAKDNDTIKSVDDLMSGKYKVAVQTGCAAYEYAAANLPESCLQSYDSQSLAYKAVEDGQADATIYDKPGTAYAIKTGQINLKIVGDEFYKGQAPYAIAFSFNICKKYPDIVSDFNAAIEQLKADGTIDELSQKWCN